MRRHAELVKASDETSVKQSKKTPVRKKTNQLDDQVYWLSAYQTLDVVYTQGLSISDCHQIS